MISIKLADRQHLNMKCPLINQWRRLAISLQLDNENCCFFCFFFFSFSFSFCFIELNANERR